MSSEKYKLFHRNKLIGTVSDIGLDFPWHIGKIEVTEAVEEFRNFFEILSKEDREDSEFPEEEYYWDDWWLEEDGERKEVGMVFIDLEKLYASYRNPDITYYSIFVRSKRKKIETLKKEFDNPVIIDVTSKAEEPWVRLSPFYPQGDIPIPLSRGKKAQSVEGIWQGLKVFENKGIDVSKFQITSMKGIKRTVRSNGKVKGHQAGLDSTELLSYKEARYKIYLPAYQYVLEKEKNLIDKLKAIAKKNELVLLDYETNPYVFDLSKPLSHASLIRSFIKNGNLEF